MGKKKRADILAWEHGLAESQDKAARLIMAGEVLLVPEKEGAQPETVKKPGEAFVETALLKLKDKNPFVGRGAYKLLSALEHFKIDVEGLIALDAGASTGGFTDCLLQRGAWRVYAVDAGTAQLHERLRADRRVVSMENTNLRLAGADLLPEAVDLAVADLSFISLKTILPVLLHFIKPRGEIIALIKPQFEVGGANTVKGVVKSEKLRKDAVDGVTAFAAHLGLELAGVMPSSIKGARGNQEYLAYWKKARFAGSCFL